MFEIENIKIMINTHWHPAADVNRTCTNCNGEGSCDVDMTLWMLKYEKPR